jgi:hypothetical protein
VFEANADKISFRTQRECCDSLPVQNSNRAYSIPLLLKSFITGIWHGANRFLHTGIIRPDRAPGKIFGWKATPVQNAYKRYFGKFKQAINQNASHHFFSCFFQSLQINYFTLDIDSTVVTRYDKQESAKKDYNPNYYCPVKAQHSILPPSYS